MALFSVIPGSSVCASEMQPVAAANSISENEAKLEVYLKALFLQCLERQRIVEVKTLAAPEDSAEGMAENMDEAMIGLSETLDELENVFKVYYGQEDGGQISRLLQQYIYLSEDYSDAVREHNDRNSIIFDMHDKADEISDFMDLLSRSWEKSGLRNVLKQYADLSAEEIEMKNQSLGKPDPDLYSKTSDKSAEIAGIFSAGIARQFPDKFR